MKPLVPLKSGDEYDALTRFRKFLKWRPGDRHKIKRAFRRRVRRMFKKEEACD